MPHTAGHTGYVPFGADQPQSTGFGSDVWGGPPFAPGQGGPGSPSIPQGGFDWSGLGQGVTQGIGGLTSLAQIYGMFQSLGLQKKAFKFAQEGTKRNFNAAATGFNNDITRRENLASSYAAANPSGDYGSLQSYGRVDKWT